MRIFVPGRGQIDTDQMVQKADTATPAPLPGQAEDLSTAAYNQGFTANQLSDAANVSGSKPVVREAMKAHASAQDLHENAAAAHKALGHAEQFGRHELAAEDHGKKAAGHKAQLQEFAKKEDEVRFFHPAVGQVRVVHTVPAEVYQTAQKTDFSESERKDLAKSGAAMADGSYPIRNGEDLHHAISLVGMSNHSESSVKAHIKGRAKSLGLEGSLPDTWKDDAKKDDDPNAAPDQQQVTFKPGPYTDIMRARHPQAKLQKPGQFESVSGQVVQPQDVPNGPEKTPNSFSK